MALSDQDLENKLKMKNAAHRGKFRSQLQLAVQQSDLSLSSSPPTTLGAQLRARRLLRKHPFQWTQDGTPSHSSLSSACLQFFQTSRAFSSRAVFRLKP